LWVTKYGPTKEDDLADSIEENIRGTQAAMELLRELDQSAADYVALFNPEHSQWNRYKSVIRAHVRDPSGTQSRANQAVTFRYLGAHSPLRRGFQDGERRGEAIRETTLVVPHEGCAPRRLPTESGASPLRRCRMRCVRRLSPNSARDRLPAGRGAVVRDCT
jgi:hypothetical protein